MTEWIAIIAGLVAIFATSARGAAWVRKKMAKMKQRRANERRLNEFGELERLAHVYSWQGASPRDIAGMLKVRKSSVRKALG